MFKDLLDFGKTRTLKQSVSFYIFYVGLFMGATGIINLLVK